VARRVTSAKAILLLAALQGATLPLAAQGAGISELFPARPAGYVTDLTGTLDTGTVARITSLAQRLRNATGAELAIAVLPTIGDRAAVDVAVAIGRAWGVGAQAAVGDPRRNTGLVILLVPKRPDDPNSGQVFIATGRGLEGIVTDYQAGRMRDLMRPYFSRGEYAAGLETGVHALAALIARGMGVADTALTAGAPDDTPARERRPGIRSWFPVILVVIFILLALSNSGRGPGSRSGRRRRGPGIFWGGGGFSGGGGGWGGGFGGGGGGGGFGGFGGGGGFSGGGAGGRF
jgi:uncharacterized protein